MSNSADPSLPGRRRFLHAVATAAPDVLRSLRDNVLPAWRRALAADRRGLLKDLRSAEDPSIWRQADGQLHQWGEQWCLRDAWLLQAAADTLGSWDYAVCEGLKVRLTWLTSHSAYAWPEQKRFQFDEEGWDPSLETRAAAKRRLNQRFDESLREYLYRIESIAAARGFVPPPSLRTRRGGGTLAGSERHYRWLAEWYICGMTHAEIADRDGSSAKLVGESIRKVAKAISLTTRNNR